MSACTPLEATKYNYVGDPSSGSSILTNLKNNLSQIKNNDPNFLTKVNYWLYSNFGDTSLVIGSIALDFQCASLTTQITACSAASAAYYSVTKTLTDYNMGKTSVLDFGNLPMDTVTGALAGYVGSKTVNFILGGKAYTWFGGGKQVVEQTSSQFKLPANAQTTLEYIQSKNFGATMEGYRGGSIYGNDTKLYPNSQKLPDGIIYKEWDTSLKVTNTPRSMERLVTGSDGSIYYTSDHYTNFVKIK